MKKYILFIILNIIITTNLFAVSAIPTPIEVEQPDGTKIEIYVKGDEFYSWHEDSDGYTILKDTDTKFWSYAKKNDFGELVASKDFVGKVSPLSIGIQKSIKDENKIYTAKQKRNEFDYQLEKSLAEYTMHNNQNINNSLVQKAYTTATGTKTNFVLLIQFKDLKFKDNKPFNSSSTDEDIRREFYNLFNREGYVTDGAVGSVKDYFKEVSYGKLNYETVISPIITIDESYLYYADSNGDYASFTRTRNMIKQALQQLDAQGFNFKEIWPNTNTPEGFGVIHAGGGAEQGNHDFIWSHKSQFDTTLILDGIRFTNYHVEPAGRGYQGDAGITRIGVICHESLHFFGLPDLYDTTYYSYGLGDFCVMASGEWNGSSGNRPAHPCAWAKSKLGWISFKTAQTGTINYIEESAKKEDAFYKFAPTTFDSREYFLMENRQLVGFDKQIPGSKGGILIYHIDERKTGNNDYTHYLVDIEEADGTAVWTRDHLARKINKGKDSDYYRSDTFTLFNDDLTNKPNSKSYTGQLSNIKISNISNSSSEMSFMYGEDVVIIEGLSNVVSYPNPARKGYVMISGIPTSPEDFSLEIFTITGKLLKAYSLEDTEILDSGERKLKWDCKNEDGQDVAPGVYIVLIKTSTDKKTFKVAVIR